MNPDKAQNFEQILESAIVLAWPELMPGPHVHDAPDGLVHIEYAFTPGGMLDDLQIWSATSRGIWYLACEFFMSASDHHGAGIRFVNGYQSKELAHILELVMQHQDSFALPQNIGRPGLIAIPTPTTLQSTGPRQRWTKLSLTSVQ